MTIDEGLRFTISGGVIKPDAVLPPWPGKDNKDRGDHRLLDDRTTG
jgi:uncharacterized membrane protein